MSPKWNNYPIYPGSGDSLSANMHPVLIKHACVLKAKLLFCALASWSVLGAEIKAGARLHW